MPFVEIGSNEYPSYADLETADEYALAATHAEAWRNADEADKVRALVTATRTLDRQTWLDAFNSFDLRVAVDNIVTAAIELAIALVDGSEVQNATTEQTQKRLKAGSVEIENFKMSADSATRFPKIVQELLAPYLGSGATFFGPVSAGTCRPSITPLDFDHNEGI
jgi:hypothetical protein